MLFLILRKVRRKCKERRQISLNFKTFYSTKKNAQTREFEIIHHKRLYQYDKTKMTSFDPHYLYHPAWAARILKKTKPEIHYDISSTLRFATIISAFIPVRFYDYRPANISLSNFDSAFADLLDLPFENESIRSLSCMHTIEHVGLGRYGDPLDYDGDIKATVELCRVLAKGGNLLFVVPVGKSNKIIFNAHRIYTYDHIIGLFNGYKLMDFSLITDHGDFVSPAQTRLSYDQDYGCGCFWFHKN